MSKWITFRALGASASGRTPPLFLRHVTPWGLLRWLNVRFPTCWLGTAQWKQGYAWSWWPERRCFNPDHPEALHRYDYCGKYGEEGDPKYAAALARVVGTKGGTMGRQA